MGNRELRLLEIIETAYAAADDNGMVFSVFTALRGLMPFASGVFMPVDPETLNLQPGLSFDCSAVELAGCLTHYTALGPALLNRTVRLSDAIAADELGNDGFSDFMQRLPYHHALGILTAVADQPVAVFSVHRHRDEADFSADELAIIDRIGPHLARATTIRRQASDSALQRDPGILVFAAGGKVLYLNAAARCFLGHTPPEVVLAALTPQGTGVISLASQCYRLSRMPSTPENLLRRFAIEQAAAAAEPGAVERGSAATRPDLKTIIVALHPFRQRVDLARRLALHGLSPRQSGIAGAVIRGLSNGDIARQLYIAEQTFKDHLREVYRRVGVKTRTELLARVLGQHGTLATGRGERSTEG